MKTLKDILILLCKDECKEALEYLNDPSFIQTLIDPKLDATNENIRYLIFLVLVYKGELLSFFNFKENEVCRKVLDAIMFSYSQGNSHIIWHYEKNGRYSNGNFRVEALVAFENVSFCKGSQKIVDILHKQLTSFLEKGNLESAYICIDCMIRLNLPITFNPKSFKLATGTVESKAELQNLKYANLQKYDYHIEHQWTMGSYILSFRIPMLIKVLEDNTVHLFRHDYESLKPETVLLTELAPQDCEQIDKQKVWGRVLDISPREYPKLYQSILAQEKNGVKPTAYLEMVDDTLEVATKILELPKESGIYLGDISIVNDAKIKCSEALVTLKKLRTPIEHIVLAPYLVKDVIELIFDYSGREHERLGLKGFYLSYPLFQQKTADQLPEDSNEIEDYEMSLESPGHNK